MKYISYDFMNDNKLNNMALIWEIINLLNALNALATSAANMSKLVILFLTDYIYYFTLTYPVH